MMPLVVKKREERLAPNMFVPRTTKWSWPVLFAVLGAMVLASLAWSPSSKAYSATPTSPVTVTVNPTCKLRPLAKTKACRTARPRACFSRVQSCVKRPMQKKSAPARELQIGPPIIIGVGFGGFVLPTTFGFTGETIASIGRFINAVRGRPMPRPRPACPDCFGTGRSPTYDFTRVPRGSMKPGQLRYVGETTCRFCGGSGIKTQKFEVKVLARYYSGVVFTCTYETDFRATARPRGGIGPVLWVVNGSPRSSCKHTAGHIPTIEEASRS